VTEGGGGLPLSMLQSSEVMAANASSNPVHIHRLREVGFVASRPGPRGGRLPIPVAGIARLLEDAG
jgi:predicted transcriptional regulator